MAVFFRVLVVVSIAMVFLNCKQKKKEQPSNVSEEATIQFIENPSEERSALPRLFSNGNELYFSWTQTKDTTDYLKYAVLKNETWQAVETVTSGTDWFTNWADFPAIAENNGSVLTNTLQRSAGGTYTYDIKLNLFSSETRQWKNDLFLHTDGTQSEHGFVAIQPYEESSFFVSWLDGRNTTGGHESHKQHSEPGAMTLRSAVVHSDGTLTDETEIDARVCDCCNTAAAITANGPIVAYRDRTDQEIRDISIVRWENEAWTTPQILGTDAWNIAGCPVNGPAIAAIDTTVAVAWFTGANEQPKVYVAFSDNAGATFKTPVRMDSSEAMGRVDIALLTTNEAVICWMETDGPQTYVMVSKVLADGTKGKSIQVTKIENGRSSGFPQMEVYQNKLYFAWTEFTSDTEPFVKMSYLAVEQL